MGDEESGGKLRADLVETQRAGFAVEGYGAPDMQGTVALKNLSGKGAQAQLQHIAVGRLGIDAVKPLHIDIHLPHRGDYFAHTLGVQIHPVGHIEVEFQQVDAHRQQRPQAPAARNLRAVEVAERDAGEEVEAVDGLDGHLIRRGGEPFGIEVGHHVAAPIERIVAIDRHPKPARIRCEQADVFEIIGAEDVDGRLACLDRHEKLVAAPLPRDLEGLAALECHLFGYAGVIPFCDLYAPEGTFELALQLREIP